ncbi:MAG: hypothetical protein FJY85_11985 [Deltaproteobacteria bacterium]|nr:hypothetical protein [Chloroflexota bacterium]MBM3300663.1 hypothetical protein [Deltaproteobacteria bacterium]
MDETKEKGYPALNCTRLQGTESFHSGGQSLGFSLLSFWQWSVSDLVDNTQRGVLAEFLVARALGIGLSEIRRSWDSYDLTSPTGVKIEIKSAAFLQSWSQKGVSTISFNVQPRRAWDSENGYEETPRRHADVYVFALLAETRKERLDPLDLAQWEFYVLPTKVLNERKRSQHSITLKSLQALTSRIAWADLAREIETAAGKNAV